MASERVDITFGLKMNDLQKEIAKLPGIGEKEAKALVNAMDKEYRRNEKQAEASAKRAAKSADAAWQAQKKAAMMGAAAVAAAAGAYLKLVQDVTAARMAIIDLAEGTGFSTETLSALGNVATLSGRKLDQLLPKNLGKKIEEAADKTSIAGEAFEKLGVSSEALASGDMDRVLGETIRGLQGMEQGAERAALQTMLLGTSGRELMAAMGGGSLQDAVDQTERLGMIVGPEAVEQTKRLNDEFSKLSLAWQKGSQDMTDGLSQRLIPALSAASTAVVALGAGIGSLFERTADAGIKAAIPFYGMGLQIGGMAAAIGDGIEAGRKWNEVVNDTATATEAAGAAWEAAGPPMETARQAAARLADEQKRGAAAAREREAAERAASAALAAQGRAQDSLAATIRAATQDTLTDLEQIEQAYQDRIDQIMAVGDAAGDADQVLAAMDAADERRARDLATLKATHDAEVSARARQWASEAAALDAAADQMLEDHHARRMARMQEAGDLAGELGATLARAAAQHHAAQVSAIRAESNERTAQFRGERAGERDRIDAMLESGEISKDQHAAMRARLKEETKEKRAEHRKQRKSEYDEMIKGWKAGKRAQAAAAWIDFGRNIAALMPAFSYAGPLAPGLALGTATAAHGMALGRIRAQSPPSFSGGGAVAERAAGSSPDHVVIQAREDEGIVSPRGMAAAGPQGLEALNRGVPPQPARITLQLDSRTIAETQDRAGRVHLRPAPGMIGRATVYGRG